MARQERNNVDYFPHPVNHGKSMFVIRTKYKNDGYTAWFILLEKLGKADYHYLDLKDEFQLMYLSAEMGIENEKVISIIDDLVKMDHIDRELWENERIVFDQEFTNSVEDAYKKRNNDIVNRDTLIELLHTLGRLNRPLGRKKPSKSNLKGAGNTQRIEEDSKVKNRKFIKPTLDEVKLYCKQRGKGVNPVKWFNHYTANGWKVGKNPMVDWHAAVHTWEDSDIAAPGSLPASKGTNLAADPLPVNYGVPSEKAMSLEEYRKLKSKES